MFLMRIQSGKTINFVINVQKELGQISGKNNQCLLIRLHFRYISVFIKYISWPLESGSDKYCGLLVDKVSFNETAVSKEIFMYSSRPIVP